MNALKKVATEPEVILVDDEGLIEPKPDRRDFGEGYDGWKEYADAYYAWKDTVAEVSIKAFDRAFQKVLKEVK